MKKYFGILTVVLTFSTTIASAQTIILSARMNDMSYTDQLKTVSFSAPLAHTWQHPQQHRNADHRLQV